MKQEVWLANAVLETCCYLLIRRFLFTLGGKKTRLVLVVRKEVFWRLCHGLQPELWQRAQHFRWRGDAFSTGKKRGHHFPFMSQGSYFLLQCDWVVHQCCHGDSSFLRSWEDSFQTAFAILTFTEPTFMSASRGETQTESGSINVDTVKLIKYTKSRRLVWLKQLQTLREFNFLSGSVWPVSDFSRSKASNMRDVGACVLIVERPVDVKHSVSAGSPYL